ncbi:4'-phosphopantetheinyl transferase NpgA [Trichophyton interdigitale]|uniref:holo-[acyl-carrier-protein] synthase n=1 Tax=Trichophyton interdigitale TaxID=101480 RepID=A0A9P5D238_9EURO|nr:4'-phosphopantetheinyl transferase NpgA [Trichophyton interdigitale]KAF3901228.1 4'-phosphopantetheinyl transferase NpgA [Trichophyton interdigitale]KAG8212141.1 4'-phosphopantetheinyl transferase NpgA [Trichophyton interdigitale]
MASDPRLTRWYIDMSRWTESTTLLPLIDTLQPAEQKKVRAFYHVADRHMSLASCLLKYLYIHRTARVPWNQVVISRTPNPHCRPCYINTREAETLRLEFNVSHQASMVALAGCMYHSDARADSMRKLDPSSSGAKGLPQVGVDITCTDERERRNPSLAPSTEKDLCEFVDIFTEAFSARELEIIKAGGEDGQARSIKHRTRMFYTYWALKEAYIKMIGEGLLASLLQKLEFTNVVPPEPEDEGVWGKPLSGIEIRLKGEQVDNVRMEVVAFGQRYILATAMRGGCAGQAQGLDSWDEFTAIDIDKEVGPCARGECKCLD